MLAHLEPKALWSHFDQLRQVPRPSKEEGPVREHVKMWAASKGYPVREDAVGNVCVRVPPSKGYENAPTVILQGHLDMVAEKDKSTTFDFSKDAIPVRIDGDWVIADHTTLGADNGIGVAAAMASADDPDVTHGPLELLFTIDEETGLTGAQNLDGSMLAGRILLNMDSEEDGALFVGCAGGCTTHAHTHLHRVAPAANTVALRVEVGGLRGGHSGLNIHENRGNAIKVLARVLKSFQPSTEVLIETIEGGNKHNAIAREASAVVYVDASFAAKAGEVAQQVKKDVLTEIAAIDPNLQITVSKAEKAGHPGDARSSKALLGVLTALPHGVISMSRDIVGLTESSTNLAVIATKDSTIEITTSSRSAVGPALRAVLDQGNAVFALGGVEYQEVGLYPGWQPNMASKVLGNCKGIFKTLYNKEPKVTAIHAGLECGIIGEKLGGNVDMISYGPQLEGVHAPGEKVCISSVGRFWNFHKALLKSLK
jgi:dipeptidase D